MPHLHDFPGKLPDKPQFTAPVLYFMQSEILCPGGKWTLGSWTIEQHKAVEGK